MTICVDWEIQTERVASTPGERNEMRKRGDGKRAFVCETPESWRSQFDLEIQESKNLAQGLDVTAETSWNHKLHWQIRKDSKDRLKTDLPTNKMLTRPTAKFRSGHFEDKAD